MSRSFMIILLGLGLVWLSFVRARSRLIVSRVSDDPPAQFRESLSSKILLEHVICCFCGLIVVLKESAGGTGVRDLAPGLWILRSRHPGWTADADWQPVVTSTFVESGAERVVLDPLAPDPTAVDIWKRLDLHPPTAAVVLMPDHVRDVDVFVRRYGAKGFGPLFYFPDDIPRTKLVPIRADAKLPGGLVALFDGRGRAETPIWIPQQRVIVFGDALTERMGQLRVWDSPSHEKRELPALRAMLELPFERVIISHCDTDPVQSRAAFEKALELPPWTD